MQGLKSVKSNTKIMCQIDEPLNFNVPDIEQLPGETTDDFNKRLRNTPDPENKYDTWETIEKINSHNNKYDDVCSNEVK